MRQFLSLSLIAGLALAACGPTPGTSGAGKSEIRGTILRAAGQPLGAAKVILLNGQDQEVSSLKTGDNGTFAFPNLGSGNYRVRFSLADDIQSVPVIEYKPRETRTTEFFAQVTSQSISLDGQQTKPVEVSPITVGWKPNLAPNEGTVTTNQFPNFSWEAAPNASNYTLELLNTNGTPFFRSGDQGGVTYQLRELNGNQGSSSGQALKGSERYFRVRVGLNPGTSPGAEYGYSTAAKLKFE